MTANEVRLRVLANAVEQLLDELEAKGVWNSFPFAQGLHDRVEVVTELLAEIPLGVFANPTPATEWKFDPKGGTP